MSERGKVKAAGRDGPREVEADIFEHTAVHPSLGWDKSLWIVTHRPTGMAMAYANSHEEALAAAHTIEEENADDLQRIAGVGFGKQLTGKKYAPVRRRLLTTLAPWREL
jgi:hypothetical protein